MVQKHRTVMQKNTVPFLFNEKRNSSAKNETVPRGCLRFVIVVFPDHTHLLFLQNGTVSFCSVVSCEKNGRTLHILALI